MNKTTLLIIFFCVLYSCKNDDKQSLKMLELEGVSKAFNRSELIYDKKNPLLQKFLNSAKIDKTNLYTSDMNDILSLTADLNDSIEKSIRELKNLKNKLPNSKLIKTTIEYLGRVSDYESDMSMFLKLVTDSIEDNHLEIREKIKNELNEMNKARVDYQYQLDKFYQESKLTRQEIDSLVKR